MSTTLLQFFDPDHRALLLSAAQREGVAENVQDLERLTVSMAGLSKGGASIHHGMTWHGSGPNRSQSRPRRGIGIHFIPAHAKFASTGSQLGRLWRPFQQEGTDELLDQFFPVMCRPRSVNRANEGARQHQSIAGANGSCDDQCQHQSAADRSDGGGSSELSNPIPDGLVSFPT